MGKPRGDGTKYGVAEWYGHLVQDLTKKQLNEFAKIGATKLSGLPCPFRVQADPAAKCKKKGGVCSIRRHRKNSDNSVTQEGPLVTICPSRFCSTR